MHCEIFHLPVDGLHVELLDEAALFVGEPVEGVLPVVRAHPAHSHPAEWQRVNWKKKEIKRDIALVDER